MHNWLATVNYFTQNSHICFKFFSNVSTNLATLWTLHISPFRIHFFVTTRLCCLLRLSWFQFTTQNSFTSIKNFPYSNFTWQFLRRFGIQCMMELFKTDSLWKYFTSSSRRNSTLVKFCLAFQFNAQRILDVYTKRWVFGMKLTMADVHIQFGRSIWSFNGNRWYFANFSKRFFEFDEKKLA